MAEMFLCIWDMFGTVGFTVADLFISLKDIMIFSILGTLFIFLIVQLLGGND